ncbi:PTS sugar transporter subunit IIA [Sporosarcina aquimarina]|uniref:PTS glucose transporter subunit IIA n=1 Tax=Sporosarcina aquimarina TaxID=114975 RepID=A0ABU4FYT8_9BACL|nr:PTS glucose transporter subunit IIA [Sporosarcina aquimarina]MDW0109888.1 PTS glucose transporter subunit IIA [Sporosarcina aquimarina]
MANFFKKMAQSLKGDTSAKDQQPKTETRGTKDIEEEAFVMPIDGTVIPLSKVPDPVFAQEMMGPGFAIDPLGDTICSPVDGKVVSVFPTKHAIGLESDSGVEILIHVGLDTVKLNGESFGLLVENGQSIKRGDALLKIDVDYIRANAPSAITPVIFTNTGKEKIHLLKEGSLTSGESGLVRVDA